jgi:diaminopimelate epimerase
MVIPFTKAHGAKNDFLLTWAHEAPLDSLGDTAIPICDRHTGAGADGWIVIAEGVAGDVDGSIRLFNSDGSEAELSGNGTRCAAAFLVDQGKAEGDVRLMTGAGPKELRLIERDGRRFQFAMNMGTARIDEGQLHTTISIRGRDYDATIVDVGNPQCVIFGAETPRNWRAAGAAIERHKQFPNRTNVSFVRVVDEHLIDVKFWERGAGETMSSGTGSTGAAAAARARGLVSSPVRVLTPAGPLDIRWEGEEAWLTGPAEIVAAGEFYLNW